MRHLLIAADKPTKPLGDLFGLFFEDLNHAADGGLYAELIQNRSFAFCSMDAPQYHALTAWEAIGAAALAIRTDSPAFAENPHYLHMTSTQPLCGIRNMGFGAGIYYQANAHYAFSIYARSEQRVTLRVQCEDENHQVIARQDIEISGPWQRYTAALCAGATSACGRLSLTLLQTGTIDIDCVSLFPADTFVQRSNGMRRDIAQALADMKPRFLRFPGGCLVHDGTLNAADHGSMYRWKNTIGPVPQRPSRRNSWKYNQTLGLGFYEYFLLCEDLNAKPVPVLPGGCDPHHKRFAPMEQLQEWIDDALDLIEFANGSPDTIWGAKRAQMGHPTPFNLSYIAIGNEEVHQEFYDRLPRFVRAIQKAYPAIKIIGSAGPFAAGSEFDRGWQCARDNGIDIVDEHYYQAPEWYLAHMDRYLSYDASGPKVFLGEYASWGNQYENALVEAAFMLSLQNAPAVSMACYAPTLCHTAYPNWRPDLLYFDNHRLLKTANYHVQSMFMRHQGDVLLQGSMPAQAAQSPNHAPHVQGRLFIKANDSVLKLSDISVTCQAETVSCPDTVIDATHSLTVTGLCTAPLTLRFTARRMKGDKGLRVCIGHDDADTVLTWSIGGWENQDSMIEKRIRRRNICLTQSAFSVEDGKPYALTLHVSADQAIQTYIDGVKFNDVKDLLPVQETLFYSASKDHSSGDTILKVVNLAASPENVSLNFRGISSRRVAGMAETLQCDDLTAENSFAEPDRIQPFTAVLSPRSPQFSYTFLPQSLTILRIRPYTD